jgi:hypothetical protein
MTGMKTIHFPTFFQRLLDRFSSGIIASVLTMSHFVDRFGNDPSMQGAIVSTFNGGCFFGAAGAGWCVEHDHFKFRYSDTLL